jgi:hypothetical protein
MPSTTNFGWTTPADTDLVKDGAAAIRTLGNGVDTSFVDLKGGTSGQILAKNSNTDLDFVWIANDQGDITAVTAGTGISGGGTSGAVTITNSMATEITASGDIIVGTGSGTFDNLPIGSTGQVLTADTTVSPYKVKWATPSSGGMTLISTTTMSGASVTLSSIPQDYVSLLLVGRFFTNSTADGVLRINPNGDGGIARISGVISSGTFSSTTNILQLPATYDRTNDDNGFQLQIFNYQDVANYTIPFMWSGNFYAGAVGLMAGGILTANNGPITSLVISNTGGNWAGGTLKFYGVK